jgi:hypothetical protein
MRYAVVDVEEIRCMWGSFKFVRHHLGGPDGMSFLVIGGVPGGVYEPWPLRGE